MTKESTGEDFDRMSEHEILAYFDRLEHEAARRFEGSPPPRRSRKFAQPLDLRHVGWRFLLLPDTAVRGGPRGGVKHKGVLVGLRAAVDQGDSALVLDLGDHGMWATRRDDGNAWPADLSATAVHIGLDAVDVPVTAWKVEDADVVGAPENVERWTVRTNDLGDDRS